jgi:hypothetical protein
MRSPVTGLVLCLAIGCAQDLPSTIPLGSGPRAEARRASSGAEGTERPEPERRPEPTVVDAGSPVDASAAPVSDAALDQGGPEAGVPDAEAPASDASAIVFAGFYTGSDVTIYRISGRPDQTEPDPNAKTRVEQSAPDRIAVTLVNSATNDPICTLDATVKGNVGTLVAGQTCFSAGPLSPTVSDGKATVLGNRLLLDMTLSIDASADDQRVLGSIQYHFDGTRP